MLYKFFTVKYLRDYLVWRLLTKCTIKSIACSFLNSSWPQHPNELESLRKEAGANCKTVVQVLVTDYNRQVS